MHVKNWTERPLHRDQKELIHYLSTETGNEIFLTKKRVLRYFLLFMLLLYTSSLVFTITGIEGYRSENWRYGALVRIMILALAIASLIQVQRNKSEQSVNLLIIAQIASAFNTAIWGNTARDAYAYMGVIIPFVLALQIVNFLKSDLKFKIILNIFLFASTIIIGMWYISISKEQESSRLVATLYLGVILLLIIIITTILSSIIRVSLDNAVVRKTLFDDKTGLPNHLVLEMELSELLEEINRGERSMAVFGIHLDKLNRINHKYGYQMGDRILRKIAERAVSLKDSYRIYKAKGALFILIPRFDWTPGCNDECGKELFEFTGKPVVIKNDPMEMKLSVIGTECPNDGRSAPRLIANLYNVVARQSSGHAYQTRSINWFDMESYRETERNYLLEKGLKKMIRNKEYSLLIQPKYYAGDDTLHGGELLSRWDHPELGLLSPLEFIPLLEENGLMVDYTESIVEHITQDLNSRKLDCSKEYILAVDFNATSIMNRKFIHYIVETAKRMKKFSIEIELTEDLFLMINRQLLENLEFLKAHNIRLALDDFGTGFSNMSYLQELKVDTIKIDKRFISPLSEDRNSLGIVKALIEMSHSFGIEVVAEGVEDDIQKSILRDLGCDLIQGYLYSRPVSLDDYVKLLS